jgi:hypothetical protein
VFAYPDVGRFAVCACGAERDMAVQGGRTVRLYRQVSTAPWDPWIAPCSKYVPPAPPPPLPPPVESDAATVSTDALPSTVWKAFHVDFGRGPETVDLTEVIDGQDLDHVAADPTLEQVIVEHGIFSPVLTSRDAVVPVEVTALDGHQYRVYDVYNPRSGGYQPRDVGLAELKRMRARYLLRRGLLLRHLPDMEESERLRICKAFFPKGAPYIPPAGSPLAALSKTGGPLVILRSPEGAPVDFAELMRVLTTPGAEIPTVCPTLPKETTDATDQP